MERKGSRLESFNDLQSVEERETQKLSAVDARGDVVPQPTDANALESTSPAPLRSPLLIHRRTLLIAGGGLALAGGAVVAKEAHLATRVRNALLRVYDHAQGQIAEHQHGPQPLPDGPMQTPHDVVIFNGSLSQGWDDWSWAEHKLPDKSVTYNGKPGVSVSLAGWTGLQFHHALFDTSGLAYFQCWVRGAGRGGQDVKVYVVDDFNTWQGAAYLGDYTQGGSIAANTWRLVRIPLHALNATSINASALIIQANSAQSQGQIDLADLRLVYFPSTEPAGIQRITSVDLSTISMRFDEPMDPAMVASVANYLIAAASGTNDAAYSSKHPVAPSVARYYPNSHSVSITLPRPMHTGGKYTVTMSPMKDRFGVATKPGFHANVQVTSQPLVITADAAANRRPINPEIYGISSMDPDQARQLGVTTMRWGGNNNSRYNWKLGNAWNAASDYHFQNGNYGLTSALDSRPSGVADQFIQGAHTHGMTALMTIPMVGFVAKDSDPNSWSHGVPGRGAPPLKPEGDAIKGYDPTENRQRTSVVSRARKKAPFSDPPDLSDPTVAQDEWIHHMVNQFGKAANGGVRYYAMDNEPEIWGWVHRDVRPAFYDYEQMRDTFLDYATAVKDVDSTALITGPVLWDPSNYMYSPLDYGTDNFATHADFNKHGQMPYLEWWLNEVRKHDEKTGRRNLDVFDLHYYPQGAFNDDDSAGTSALRLRMTRSLWDPTYTDESWINRKIRLIPQMHDWINKYYPGTKLCLSEWNWGGEDAAYGAVAVADVLGIFGREGLDSAYHWGDLSLDRPSGMALKLYANYDGNHHRFDGTSFKAASTNQSLLASYATQAADGAVLLMLINKSPDSDLSPQIHMNNFSSAFGGASPSRIQVWRYWPNDTNTITRGPDITLPSGGSQQTLTYTLPALSINLLRIEAGL